MQQKQQEPGITVAVRPIQLWAGEDTWKMLWFASQPQINAQLTIKSCHTLSELCSGSLKSLPCILLLNWSTLTRKSMWTQTKPESSNNHTCQHQLAFKRLVIQSFYRRWSKYFPTSQDKVIEQFRLERIFGNHLAQHHARCGANFEVTLGWLPFPGRSFSENPCGKETNYGRIDKKKIADQDWNNVPNVLIILAFNPGFTNYWVL